MGSLTEVWWWLQMGDTGWLLESKEACGEHPAPSVTEGNLGRWTHSPHLLHMQMSWDAQCSSPLGFLTSTCVWWDSDFEGVSYSKEVTEQVNTVLGGKNEKTLKQGSLKGYMKHGSSDITGHSNVV